MTEKYILKDLPNFSEYAAGNPGPWHGMKADMVPAMKNFIVDMYSRGHTRSEIAGHLDIRPALIKQWEKDDKSFAQRVEDAKELRYDDLEDMLVTRVRQGVEEPVVSNGRVIMDPTDATKVFTVRKIDNDLLKFALKSVRRATYGDKVETTNTHAIDTDGALARFETLLDAAVRADPPSEPTPVQ